MEVTLINRRFYKQVPAVVKSCYPTLFYPLPFRFTTISMYRAYSSGIENGLHQHDQYCMFRCTPFCAVIFR